MDRPYNYFTLKSAISLIFDIEAWFKVTVYTLPTGKMWVNYIALKGRKYTCTQVMSMDGLVTLGACRTGP